MYFSVSIWAEAEKLKEYEKKKKTTHTSTGDTVSEITSDSTLLELPHITEL
jgi:hypothetical protein